MGIKVFEFLRRAKGMSSEEFHADWRDVHGPMLANDPDLRRHVTRYELNHRLPHDLSGASLADDVRDDGYDGVAVLWLDSMEELRALSAEPGMAAIRERAPRLHEEERLIVVTEDPNVIVSTPNRDEAGAKMLCILRRNAALDLDTFHDHWLNHHGGLFQNIPELRDPAPRLRPESRPSRSERRLRRRHRAVVRVHGHVRAIAVGTGGLRAGQSRCGRHARRRPASISS